MSVLHKIEAVFLALLIVVATVGLTVENHYCCNTLVDVTYFSTSQHCKAAMPADTTTNYSKTACCRADFRTFKVEEFVSELAHKNFKYLPSFCFRNPFSDQFVETKRGSKICTHTSLLLVKNLHVLHEVFII